MYIPDELKVDVANFLQSGAGKFLINAARARLPLTPSPKSALHTIAVEYAYREGAEWMLNEIQLIHTEEDPTPKGGQSPHAALLQKIQDKNVDELSLDERMAIAADTRD